MALKKQFNTIKYAHPDWLDSEGEPWLRTIHRDAHAQPFANLAKAWSRYFAARKASQPAYPPRLKKKGRCRDSFYIANDKFRVEGWSAVLPKVGRVALAETLRFSGKIMGATVSRTADHWFVAVQIEVPDCDALKRRTDQGVVGVDLAKKSQRRSRCARRCVVYAYVRAASRGK
jgi:putative transposase